jgi:hypothetical protein
MCTRTVVPRYSHASAIPVSLKAAQTLSAALRGSGSAAGEALALGAADSCLCAVMRIAPPIRANSTMTMTSLGIGLSRILTGSVVDTRHNASPWSSPSRSACSATRYVARACRATRAAGRLVPQAASQPMPST